MRIKRIIGTAVIAGVAWLVCLSGPEARAQRGREVVRIRRVNAAATRTPEYTTRGSVQHRVRDWLQIIVEYDVLPDEWIDELEFHYYVLLKGRDARAEPFTLLTGSIAYVHIQRDRRLESVMYVHPSIMARFGALEAVAVEVKRDGTTIAVDGQGSWQPWQQWQQQLTARAGHVMRPDQTPFAVLAADNYEMVKPGSR